MYNSVNIRIQVSMFVSVFVCVCVNVHTHTETYTHTQVIYFCPRANLHGDNTATHLTSSLNPSDSSPSLSKYPSLSPSPSHQSESDSKEEKDSHVPPPPVVRKIAMDQFMFLQCQNNDTHTHT
eukprot:GHVR01167576.1.p1 GENE.GHVR01167576.1~~GHVR01167576.1.p1  ORF type:complete len:123 (-),score=39.72 GHVR01167576.1:133-501(-)